MPYVQIIQDVSYTEGRKKKKIRAHGVASGSYSALACVLYAYNPLPLCSSSSPQYSRWSNVGKNLTMRLENSSSHPLQRRRLHLTRFRPPSVSSPLLCSGGSPPFLRIWKDTPSSVSLSYSPSDCYRRTDHAVIRDYISRRGMMERILSHQTMTTTVPSLSLDARDVS